MIPIVFGVSEDPVKLGLVASIARPGGNATGVSFLLSELGAKQLGLLRELIPAASRVGLLVNPNNENAKAIISDLKSAAAMNRARSGLPSRSLPRPRKRAVALEAVKVWPGKGGAYRKVGATANLDRAASRAKCGSGERNGH